MLPFEKSYLCDRCGHVTSLNPFRYSGLQPKKEIADLNFEEVFPFVRSIPADLDIGGGCVTFDYTLKKCKVVLCGKCKKEFKRQFREFVGRVIE
jgi:hypothetical protein